MEEEIEELIKVIGTSCSGHRLGAVLSAFTYILADICVGSGIDRDKIIADLSDNIDDAIEAIMEESNGNRSYH
jgi:hypothetical protein